MGISDSEFKLIRYGWEYRIRLNISLCPWSRFVSWVASCSCFVLCLRSQSSIDIPAPLGLSHQLVLFWVDMPHMRLCTKPVAKVLDTVAVTTYSNRNSPHLWPIPFFSISIRAFSPVWSAPTSVQRSSLYVISCLCCVLHMEPPFLSQLYLFFCALALALVPLWSHFSLTCPLWSLWACVTGMSSKQPVYIYWGPPRAEPFLCTRSV